MEERLDLIYKAASNLFINKGYKYTQIKDIAKEVGLSTGMIYVYFKGKKEILNFILKVTIEPNFIKQEFNLPIDSSLFVNLEEEMKLAMKEYTSSFSQNLKNVKEYPFEKMLDDAFNIVSKYAIGCLLIEKNPTDLKILAEFYREYRKKFFEDVYNYLLLYIKNNTVRKVEYVEHTVGAIIQTISWWGMHVMNKAFEVQKDISLEVAKSVCMDNLLNAYKI